MTNGRSLSCATGGAIIALYKYNKMSFVEIGLIDTCNKFKVTHHHASREKRPLRYPPYGPEVAIPKEVPILGPETRVDRSNCSATKWP